MISTTLDQACINCTRSDRSVSLGILRSAQCYTRCTCSAPARIALFPGKYIDSHHFASSTRQACTLGSHSFPGNTSIRTTVPPAYIKRTRSDGTLSQEILRSAQLRITCASNEHSRIALFPRKYGNLLHFASNAHPVHTLGSHFFPGNTSICTPLH